MKAKIILALFVGAMILPAITSLFDLEARRRATTIIITVGIDDQTEISPN
jgi:hypothetical protein